MTTNRNSKYNLHQLQEGEERLIGLAADGDMHTIRVAVSAFGTRNGRKFQVCEFVPGVAKVVRLPDDFVRERSSSKYNFHRLEIGDQIEVPMSRGAQNAALVFGKRNGKVLTTAKTSAEILTVKRIK